MPKYTVHIHYKFDTEKFSMREAHKHAVEEFLNRELNPETDFKVKITKPKTEK